jgi:lysophospholipase L1-like esterase
MRRLSAWLLAWLILAAPVWFEPARAEDPGECLVAEHQVEHEFRLKNVGRAVAGKHLNILVMGAGSSVLPGPNGVKLAYPGRLQNALNEKLPGVTVNVVADVKARRTAGDMVQTLPAALKEAKPALVIWQTGTVDAMLSIDPDQFSAALDRGINTARSAGADVVLVNSQYSPRTESVIAVGTYTENMRWVAVQQEVPVFDRFNIMKTWSDLGTFDLTAAKNKLDIAERVHDCIGRLLADLVIEAVQPSGPPIGSGR